MPDRMTFDSIRVRMRMLLDWLCPLIEHVCCTCVADGYPCCYRDEH